MIHACAEIQEQMTGDIMMIIEKTFDILHPCMLNYSLLNGCAPFIRGF
jgi:hypothetical protein